MDKSCRIASIQLPIAPRLGSLGDRLERMGDNQGAADARRLTDAVAFLESEIARHRAGVVPHR